MKNNIFGQNRMGICYEESQGQTWRIVVLRKKKNVSEPLCNLTVSSHSFQTSTSQHNQMQKNDATLQSYFCSVVETDMLPSYVV